MATNQAKATLLGYSGDVPIVIKGSEQGIGVIFPHLPLNTVLQQMWIELYVATYLRCYSYGK